MILLFIRQHLSSGASSVLAKKIHMVSRCHVCPAHFHTWRVFSQKAKRLSSRTPKTRLTRPLGRSRNLLGMARAAAANLRGLVGIAAAGRRRVTASVATPRASPGGRGFRAVASGSGGRTTPESSSSSSPALPQLQPRRGLATTRAVLRNLISGGLER